MQETPTPTTSFTDIRLRFELLSPLTPDEVAQRMQSALNTLGAKCKGTVSSRFITIYIPQEEQHYWSPQLRINVEGTEEGCQLNGLYGPRPAIWTMFVFFYSLIALSALVVTIIGLSSYSLGQAAHVLWLLPIFILLFLSLYLTAYLGKKWGREQILQLHLFVEPILDLKNKQQ